MLIHSLSLPYVISCYKSSFDEFALEKMSLRKEGASFFVQTTKHSIEAQECCFTNNRFLLIFRDRERCNDRQKCLIKRSIAETSVNSTTRQAACYVKSARCCGSCEGEHTACNMFQPISLTSASSRNSDFPTLFIASETKHGETETSVQQRG